jgi:hypothetical protein
MFFRILNIWSELANKSKFDLKLDPEWRNERKENLLKDD